MPEVLHKLGGPEVRRGGQVASGGSSDAAKGVRANLQRLVRDRSPGTVLIVGRDSMELAAHLGGAGKDTVTVDAPGPGLAPAGLVIWNAGGISLELLDADVSAICRAADDIVVLREPLEDWDAHGGLPPLPEDFSRAFAGVGFARDLDDAATATSAGAARYRRLQGGVADLAFTYERRFSVVGQTSEARRGLLVEQREALARAWQAEMLLDERDAQIAKLAAEAHDLREEAKRLAAQAAGVEAWREGLYATPAWRIAHALQRARGAVLPPGSRRDLIWHEATAVPRAARRAGVSVAAREFARALGPPAQEAVVVPPVALHPPAVPRAASVDVIVCVHDALNEVRACLESAAGSARLIIVDDGSGAPTRDFLAEFVAAHGGQLIRNESARGYTFAANQGLAASTADFACLLNSDTVVAPGWLDGLVACADSDPRIGIVGPLSNTASWQSVPEVSEQGDWASNPLPDGVSVADMAGTVERYSARIYPPVPLLNGFCLLLRRACLEAVGTFDERAFGAGYGEEDDLVLRARKAGWLAAVADNVYVFHAQSASYSSEARRQLSERAGKVLAGLHGSEMIESGVREMADGRVMRGLRARARAAPERAEWEERGRAYAGKRILFVLPVAAAGGGANVVLFEARALRRMGVDAVVYNSPSYRAGFEAAYSPLDVPVIYGDRATLASAGPDFDAVIATAHYSVDWLAGLPRGEGGPVKAYYVQGFEPFMHAPGSTGFQEAWGSYTGVADLVRFSKTAWTARQVSGLAGVSCVPTGIDVDGDLFCARPRRDPEWPARSLRVAAMIRPNSPYRSPELTMDVLGEACRRHGRALEAWLFGVAADDPALVRWRKAFSWKCAGFTAPAQTAALLNEMDIFVDFSTHQAMGLTALEAMACGVAVIAPAEGGAVEFVEHEVNGLIADTSGSLHCAASLERLITDHALRTAVQRRALEDAAAYFPEQAAVRILDVLFSGAS